jgi:ABC-type lipoprotein release transport system permease subunit
MIAREKVPVKSRICQRAKERSTMNPSMQAWQIVLLVIVVLLFFYVGVLIYVMSMVRVFRSRLRKRLIAMSVLLSEKKEMLLAINYEFKKSKVKLDKADQKLYDQVQFLKISELKDVQIAPASQILKDAQNRLNFVAQINPWATKSEEYQTYANSIHDIDVNFRQNIVLYNSDLNGYNYWVAVPACRWFAYIFGNRKKQPLN